MWVAFPQEQAPPDCVCQLCSGEFGGALDPGGPAGYIYALRLGDEKVVGSY
jgi:hypothetical protein